ncbi:MAG: hypothetical protein LBG96_10330 [Tannerella sp.]|jgi:hypothetical protein|nr:hypothetical protein [Tannerella sp.]
MRKQLILFLFISRFFCISEIGAVRSNLKIAPNELDKSVSQQGIVVSGIVSDENGEPLISVTLR